MTGWYGGLVILFNDEGDALIAALAVGVFPVMMVLGIGGVLVFYRS